MDSALCMPDSFVFHQESSTCGDLKGHGTDGSGTPVELAGEVVVGGFGEPTFYHFPNLTGSLFFSWSGV